MMKGVSSQIVSKFYVILNSKVWYLSNDIQPSHHGLVYSKTRTVVAGDNMREYYEI